jgi:hypothetical protein
MATHKSESADPANLDVELHELLKSESSSYFEKLQAIWLQKFVPVGAVVAFLVTNYDKLPQLDDVAVVHAGVLAVPILSVLLDAKIMEFSLHTRAISRFIENQFSGAARQIKWEAPVCGTAGPEDQLGFARLRSLATALTAVVPPMVISILASIVLGELTHQPLWLGVGAGRCLAYGAVALFALITMWPRDRA